MFLYYDRSIFTPQIHFSFNPTETVAQEMFCKKGVLRNFAKVTGKQLCQSLCFNRIAGLRPATLSKKRLWNRFFPVNLAKFLRTPFLKELLRLQLLTPFRKDFFGGCSRIKSFTNILQC